MLKAGRVELIQDFKMGVTIISGHWQITPLYNLNLASCRHSTVEVLTRYQSFIQNGSL